MFERRIYEVLDAGRAHINEDPSFIVEFFCDQGLTVAEAGAIRDFWLAQDRFFRKSLDNTVYEQVVGVNIVHQFPRTSNQPQFPCWAIVLENENEGTARGERFLGDEIDDVEVIGEGLVSFTGSIEHKRYGVYVYADNPDVCVYYYELLSFFLKRARDFLKSEDGGRALDTAFSGNDMGPDPRYGPETMFVRRFGIEVKVLEAVRKQTQEQRGTRLGGAFVRNPEGLDVTVSGDGETISPSVTPVPEE